MAQALTAACLQAFRSGGTVLHCATSKLALDIVELLLKLGADVHATDRYVSSLSQQDHQHWQAIPLMFMTFRLLAYSMHQMRRTSHTLGVCHAANP